MKMIASALFVAAGTLSMAHADEKAAKPHVTMFAAGDLKWADVPGVKGVQMAVVQGDPATGPHHAFHKFAAGFVAPLHHHTSDHFVTVISGNLTITAEGQPAKTMGPGSFFEFSGPLKHTTKCEPGADCVLSIDCRGKWDVVIAEAKKPAPEAKPKK